MQRILGTHVKKVKPAEPLMVEESSCCACDALSFILRTVALLVALGAAAFAAARVREVTDHQGGKCPLTMDLATSSSPAFGADLDCQFAYYGAIGAAGLGALLLLICLRNLCMRTFKPHAGVGPRLQLFLTTVILFVWVAIAGLVTIDFLNVCDSIAGLNNTVAQAASCAAKIDAARLACDLCFEDFYSELIETRNAAWMAVAAWSVILGLVVQRFHRALLIDRRQRAAEAAAKQALIEKRMAAEADATLHRQSLIAKENQGKQANKNLGFVTKLLLT